MKKTAGILFSLLTAVYMQAAPTAQLYTYPTQRNTFLAHKLAKNEPVSYCIYLSENAQENISAADFDFYIRLAFKLWTAYPAHIIRETGRAEELSQELQVLEKEPSLQLLPVCNFSAFPEEIRQQLPLHLRYASAPQADVSFFVDDKIFALTPPQKGYSKPLASPYSSPQPVLHIVIPEKNATVLKNNTKDGEKPAQLLALQKQLLDTPTANSEEIAEIFQQMSLLRLWSMAHSLPHLLTHEIGHAIGLADQSNLQDNEDLIYGTVRPQKSIMDNATTSLTCDDADGIVLLLDKEIPIRRADYSSLCPNSNIRFSYGKENFTGTKKREKPGYERTYYPDTKDTGIYLKRESMYIDLEDKTRIKHLFPELDRSQMPRKGSGYQIHEGQMRMINMEQDPDEVVPIGRHTIQITLGAGAPYKQLVILEYDNDGNLQSGTREIYKEGNLKKSQKINPLPN